MSDGPHRSLRMRRGWKKVAEFADNDASGPEDVRGAAGPALSLDWSEDVPGAVSDGLFQIFGPEQKSLFPEDKGRQLEALRPHASPDGLGQVLIDCALKTAGEGKSGNDAAVQATVDALRIWGARHVRQIEEHYLRNCAAPRAATVRDRTEEGVLGAVGKQLAQQLLGISDSGPSRQIRKQTGLDDGVKL